MNITVYNFAFENDCTEQNMKSFGYIKKIVFIVQINIFFLPWYFRIYNRYMCYFYIPVCGYWWGV